MSQLSYTSIQATRTVGARDRKERRYQQYMQSFSEEPRHAFTQEEMSLGIKDNSIRRLSDVNSYAPPDKPDTFQDPDIFEPDSYPPKEQLLERDGPIFGAQRLDSNPEQDNTGTFSKREIEHQAKKNDDAFDIFNSPPSDLQMKIQQNIQSTILPISLDPEKDILLYGIYDLSQERDVYSSRVEELESDTDIKHAMHQTASDVSLTDSSINVDSTNKNNSLTSSLLSMIFQLYAPIVSPPSSSVIPPDDGLSMSAKMNVTSLLPMGDNEIKGSLMDSDIIIPTAVGDDVTEIPLMDGTSNTM